MDLLQDLPANLVSLNYDGPMLVLIVNYVKKFVLPKKPDEMRKKENVICAIDVSIFAHNMLLSLHESKVNFFYLFFL